MKHILLTSVNDHNELLTSMVDATKILSCEEIGSSDYSKFPESATTIVNLDSNGGVVPVFVYEGVTDIMEAIETCERFNKQL